MQKLLSQFKRNTYFIASFVVTLVLFIITFPQLELTYSHGGDEPLIWVFNWLFLNDFSSARTILFPHGPLDFLRTPIPSTLWLFLIVDFSIKYIFVLLLLFLNKKNSKPTYLIGIVFLAYLFFLLSNSLIILIFSILLAFILAFETNRVVFKYLAYFLISFCAFLKTYSAVISLGMGLIYLIYVLIKTKDLKQFFIDGVTLFVFLFLTFVILFQTADGFLTFFLGIINLSMDNSSACSFYTENNWWFVISSMMIAVFLPFVNRNSQAYFYGFMMIFPLFAVFKHGMARTDGAHIHGFLIFLFLNFMCFLFYVRKRLIINSILIGCSLTLLFLNFNYKTNRFDLPIPNLINVSYFVDFVSNYDSILNQAEKQTKENISYRKVSNELKREIGNASVDVYPWDYSIIAANDFKWHPRPVINSYAAYTSWLDKQDAVYFESEKAPQYFIWDFSQGLSLSANESEVSSIDGRYLLNDEPQTILSLLSNYEFIKYENTLNIYKRKKQPIKYYSQKSAIVNNLINTWISLPKVTNQQMLRANVFFKRNLIHGLKSFFYKDEQYWMYLKFSDNTIQKIRIVPKNAKDGIWLNPFIYKSTVNPAPLIVKEIMFKNSNQELLDKDFDLQFETYDFQEQNVVSDFFPNSINLKNNFYYEKTINFDSIDGKIDTPNFDENSLTKKEGFNNSKSFLLLPNQFSFSFKMNVDSCTSFEVISNCWVNSLNRDVSGLCFAYSFLDENKNQLEWCSGSINDQLLNRNDWNFCSHYSYRSFKSIEISFCLWNNSRDTIIFDNLYLKVIGRKD